MLIRLTTFFVAAFAVGSFLFGRDVDSAYAPVVEFEDVYSETLNETILFTGDVMLGRDVESRMINMGSDYPFKGLGDIVAGEEFVVGNFEGTVPEEHVKTKPMQMKFSVQEDYVSKLKEVGFDVFSLSNNHSFDYGEEAYINTQQICVLNNIECFGHPSEINTYSVIYKDVGDEIVGILALHTLYGDIDEAYLKSQLSIMSANSDVQVVYVHWGLEYELAHSDKQKMFAHKLIDNGVDTVIGHHPHVVQDIEIYKDKPIFYSLGNFIFDQYFSEDVQEGLIVKQNIYDEKIEYLLVPITSIDTRNQPNLMSVEAKAVFLNNLSERSDEVLTKSISEGRIVVTR